MYISRRGDIVGPPVWKSTISPHLSKSKHQQHTLSPLHHHMLTLPGYPTALSHTWNPSNIEHDTLCIYCSVHVISFLLRHPAGIYPLECPFCRYIGAP